MEEMITIWVTKWATTRGILKFNARVCSPDGSMVETIDGKYTMYFHKNEWHRTPEEALSRANEMRLNEIKSHEEEIEKLRSMVFIFRSGNVPLGLAKNNLPRPKTETMCPCPVCSGCCCEHVPGLEKYAENCLNRTGGVCSCEREQ